MLEGLPEVEGIYQIHQILNAPGTISLGYNTLGFDDEFLRFSFYRNLLTPYTHQFASGCGRMDLYPICILYYLYKPDILKWPKIDGKISLKLEHLNEFNQLSSGHAHRAIDDVKTTLALAKIFHRDQSMWQYACKHFDRKNELQRISQLTSYSSSHFYYPQAILIDGQFGKDAHFQCPVLGLGTHKYFSNRTLWLRLDRSELRETTESNIAQNTWAIAKKVAEPGLLLPIKDRYLAKLPSHLQEQMKLNLSWLMEQPQLLTHIMEYHQNFVFEKIPNLDAYAMLYDGGFPTNDEIRYCQLFHQSKPEAKVNMLSYFSNDSFRELALRILGKHFYNDLTPALQEEFNDYLNRIATQPASRIDYKGTHALGKEQALKEIADLKLDTSLTVEQIKLLDELEEYLDSL